MPTPETKELPKTPIPEGWKVLGKGGYNQAYVDLKTGTLVLKANLRALGLKKNRLHPALERLDTPSRSVALWNQINSTLPPAYRYKSTDQKFSKAWICPRIIGWEAPDIEMSRSLIDIFNKHGRVVVDSYASNNFLRDQNGQVTCIDLGQAFCLVETDSLRRSEISFNAWKALESVNDESYEKYIDILPCTIHTTRALIFIQRYTPDITNASFLTYELIDILSEAFKNRATQPDLVIKAKILLNNMKINLLNELKVYCINKLNDYIASRVSQEGVYSYSGFFTKNFRDIELTNIKVKQVRMLKTDISRAQSANEISDLLSKLLVNPELTKARIKSDLQSCLLKCTKFTKNTAALDPYHEEPGISFHPSEDDEDNAPTLTPLSS